MQIADTNQRQDAVAEEVYKLVEAITGIRVAELRENPGLRINATVDGDDAVELMRAFADKFNVNMDGYQHDRYFGSEGISNPMSTLYSWVRQLLAMTHALEPLRAADLVEAARAKRWRSS